MERPPKNIETPKTLEEIIAREPILQRAYVVASDAHKGETRDDETPYISHCVEVARILFEEWGINDPEILSAGLLHDTEENTKLTPEDLKCEFGDYVESLVDSVSKFRPNTETELPREVKDRQTHRKFVERSFLNPTVGIIKLADRLHNMRTLHLAKEDRRVRNAVETLDIYSPMAESLGMWVVKTELENLAFPYADPENFARFSKLYNEDPRTKDPFRSHMQSKLESILERESIRGNIEIRENSLVRLKDKKHPFYDINDVISFRVIVRDGDVYPTLRILQEEFKDQEDPSRFDNFYITPKFNLYSAIQITLDTNLGAIEIAVTSKEREDYNNWGMVSLLRNGEKSLQKYALKLVITPSGQAKFLPPAATGEDLAYLINKKTAAQATGIIVDGERRPLSIVIPNSADVEIIYESDRIAPSREDVALSLPSTQKKAEKQFLEQKIHDEEVTGKEKVLKIISQRGLLELEDLHHLAEHEEKLVNLLNYSGSKRSASLLYWLVGTGVITEKDLEHQLDSRLITKKDLGLTSVLIEGNNKSDLLSFFSKEMGKRNGDIRWHEGGSKNGKIFRERFVIKNLSPESEKEILYALKANPSVISVVVV